MSIKRHLTLLNYISLDPNNVWIFQAETDEECFNLLEGLNNFKHSTGIDINALILPSTIQVEELSIDELERMIQQLKERRNELERNDIHTS